MQDALAIKFKLDFNQNIHCVERKIIIHYATVKPR